MQPDNQYVKILTVKEVAQLLRIDRSTISRYAIAGKLKIYMIGNRRLFKEKDGWSFFEKQAAHKGVSGKEA